MARVEFTNPPALADVKSGTSLLQAARLAGAPVASTCGGVAACSSCHVIVQQGATLLSEMDDDEESVISMARDAGDTSRLACQAEVVCEGRVVVEISQESASVFRGDQS